MVSGRPGASVTMCGLVSHSPGAAAAHAPEFPDHGSRSDENCHPVRIGGVNVSKCGRSVGICM